MQNDASGMKFRFRKEDSQHGYVWIDISDPKELLPLYNTVVTAKILKLDSVAVEKRKIHLKMKKMVLDKSLPSFSPPVSNSGATSKSQPPPVPPRRNKGGDSSDSQRNSGHGTSSSNAGSGKMQPPPHMRVPADGGSGHGQMQSSASNSGKFSKTVKAVPSNNVDILNEEDGQNSPFHHQEQPNLWEDAHDSPHGGGGSDTSPHPDILSFDDDHYGSGNGKKATQPVADFLDFGSSPSTTAGRKPPSRPTNSSSDSMTDIDEGRTGSSSSTPLDRSALAAKREDQISEKVANALDFKKTVRSLCLFSRVFSCFTLF
jgi:hypothetical protein